MIIFIISRTFLVLPNVTAPFIIKDSHKELYSSAIRHSNKKSCSADTETKYSFSSRINFSVWQKSFSVDISDAVNVFPPKRLNIASFCVHYEIRCSILKLSPSRENSTSSFSLSIFWAKAHTSLDGERISSTSTPTEISETATQSAPLE